MLGTQSKDSDIHQWRAFYRDGSFPENAETSVEPCKVIDDQGTVKFLLKLNDGLEIESVILPISGFKRKRHTLCVSSQVGCAMGCDFCQTAQMGLLRNLTTAEIIAQWHAATHALKSNIDNIVFMGMGEPLENLDTVIEAIKILTDQNGPSVAPSKICVSTVGRVEGIYALADFAKTDGYKRISLAVSMIREIGFNARLAINLANKAAKMRTEGTAVESNILKFRKVSWTASREVPT